jgi:hypothetical protein
VSVLVPRALVRLSYLILGFVGACVLIIATRFSRRVVGERSKMVGRLAYHSKAQPPKQARSTARRPRRRAPPVPREKAGANFFDIIPAVSNTLNTSILKRTDMAFGDGLWVDRATEAALLCEAMVTRRAVRNYGYDLGYHSKTDWPPIPEFCNLLAGPFHTSEM